MPGRFRPASSNRLNLTTQTETLEPRRRSGHQFDSALWQLKVSCEQPGDRIVGLAINRRLADVDNQLTVGTDLDQGSFVTAGLDADDHRVGHRLRLPF